MSGVTTSKQIRRRQAQIEEKIFRPRRPKTERRIQVPTAAEFEAVVDKHADQMRSAIDAGDAESARWYAKLAVQYRRTWRALQICRDYKRAFWKASIIARHELYNCEIGVPPAKT